MVYLEQFEDIADNQLQEDSEDEGCQYELLEEDFDEEFDGDGDLDNQSYQQIGQNGQAVDQHRIDESHTNIAQGNGIASSQLDDVLTRALDRLHADYSLCHSLTKPQSPQPSSQDHTASQEEGQAQEARQPQSGQRQEVGQQESGQAYQAGQQENGQTQGEAQPEAWENFGAGDSVPAASRDDASQGSEAAAAAESTDPAPETGSRNNLSSDSKQGGTGFGFDSVEDAQWNEFVGSKDSWSKSAQGGASERDGGAPVKHGGKSRVRDILLTEEKKATILQAMKSISLDYRPRWAESIGESYWMGAVKGATPMRQFSSVK